MKRIYLDHNATTPTSPSVASSQVEAMSSLPGNPSSIHREGQRARAAVEDARRRIGDALGASFTEVVFTSGATEANNLAIATLIALGGPVATTAIEHPSVLGPLEVFEASGGEVVRLEVDATGALPPVEAILEALVARGARGLSVMLANNEIGNLYPVEAIAAAAREAGIVVHIDATQGVGKVPVSFSALGAEMMSVSAHKFYGPKGVGALLVQPEVVLAPLVRGGHQERGRRSGTENVPAIVAMGTAAAGIDALLEDAPRQAALVERLWEGILAVEGRAARQGASNAADRLPNTLNVRFDAVDGETLLMNLDLAGIAVSAGSACSAGSMEPSHVILAMGVPLEQARGSVRFSLGVGTSAEEIDAVIARLPSILERSRRL